MRERIRKGIVSSFWFGGPDIKASAQSARTNCVTESRLVNHATAAGVHQDGARLQCGKELLVDQVVGVVAATRTDTDYIAELGKVDEAGAESTTVFDGFFFGEIAAPSDHIHAERATDLCHFLSHLSKSNNSKRAPVQSNGVRKFALLPMSCSQCGGLLGNSSVACQDQRPCKFRYSGCIAARAIRYKDAAATCGGNVHMISTGSSHHDHRQARAGFNDFR